MVSKVGSIYSSDDGVLTEKAYLMAAELSEDDYNSLMESYGSYYEINDYEGYKYTAKYFTDDTSSSDVYDIYFIYNEGLVTQVMFINASESEEKTLLNSLSLPSALESTDSAE